jgi:N utilization substance protein A
MANSNKQFVHNIIALADERKIPRDTVVDSIKDAIIKAYVKEYPESNVEVEIDLNNESLIIKTLFNVVEDYDDLNDYSEISVEDAKKEYSKDSKVGDVVKKEVDISELETSIINGIKQLFKHNITSESNKQIFSD